MNLEEKEPFEHEFDDVLVDLALLARRIDRREGATFAWRPRPRPRLSVMLTTAASVAAAVLMLATIAQRQRTETNPSEALTDKAHYIEQGEFQARGRLVWRVPVKAVDPTVAAKAIVEIPRVSMPSTAKTARRWSIPRVSMPSLRKPQPKANADPHSLLPDRSAATYLAKHPGIHPRTPTT